MRIVPMIHVPDVAATAQWYKSIGFNLSNLAEEDEQAIWASLSYGESEIMLSCSGKPSNEWRREFDLYIYVENVDELCQNLKGRVEIVEDLHDTFYGMREFIIRDINRF